MSVSARRLLTSSLVYTFGDFLVLGTTSFLLIPLYLRYMGPSDYGIYGSVTTMTGILSAIYQFGMVSAIARFYYQARDRGVGAEYLGALWLVQVGIAALLSVVLFAGGDGVWHWIMPQIPRTPFLPLVVASSAVSYTAALYSLWLRIEEQPGKFVLVQVGNVVVLLAAVIWFVIFRREGAYGAVLAALASNCLMAAVSFVLLRRHMRLRLRGAGLRESLAFGGWMMSGTVAYYVLNRSQVFVLQRYAPLSEVGVFFLALQLSGVLVLLSNSFAKAWQPMVYSARSANEAALVISRTSKYFVIGVMWLALGLALLAPDILRILGQRPTAEGVRVLQLSAIAMAVYVLSGLPSAALLYERKAALTQVVTVACAALNVGVSIVLIPRWGTVGAAMAMLVSYLLLGGISFRLAHVSMPVPYDWAALATTIVAGIAFAAAGNLVSPGLGHHFDSAIRLALLLCYPVALVVLRIITAPEMAAVARGVAALAGRMTSAAARA